ncbi:MAG: phospholipid carrier-dependent glycosyltransferase [Chloroflexia bacterium]
MSTGAKMKSSAGRVLGPAAVALMIYGALGIVLNLRLPALVVASLGSLAGGAEFHTTPGDLPWLAPLSAHYADRPWLPWAAWLLGLAFLSILLLVKQEPGREESLPPRIKGRERGREIVAGAVLLGLLALGAYARLNLLLPQARGLTQAPYDDEGVYAGAGQLLLQGILPYRDYFFAHPPLAALVYTPALAYHFTEWGSVTSFMLARYLSVAYSLGALAALFVIGRQLGGSRLRGLLVGATAALLWAIDGRAIEINRKVMLDQPMILASMLALVAYLTALSRIEAGRTRSGRRLLLLAGALAAASAFTKIQGLACITAIGLDLLWRLRLRQPRLAVGIRLADVGALAGGFAAVAVAVLGPFLLFVPDRFIRMVVFFQLLRPSDGVVTPPARIANLTSVVPEGPNILLNGPSIYLAALGFAALTWWAIGALNGGRQPDGDGAEDGALGVGRWRLIVIWSFLSVLLFTYSRSFYSHYYIQLVAPLCLLGGAVWLPLLGTRRQTGAGRLAAWRPALALLMLPALILAVPAWQGDTTRYEDQIFAIVSRFVNDAVPPGSPVLATDEQFAFLASRPPSKGTTGYMIDSYGHMIYLGLGLGGQSWGDLLGASLHGGHSDDAYAVMHRAAPQADFLERARLASLVVVHKAGEVRLTPETLRALEDVGTVRERKARYVIIAPR